MFSDPLLAHRDNIGASTHTRAYDRLPSTGTKTVYKGATFQLENVDTIEISHQLVGSGVKQRTRHLVSVNGFTMDSATTEDRSLPPIRMYVVLDLPTSAGVFSTTKMETMFEQLSGLMRGNSVNDASTAIDYDEVFRPLIAGQS